MAASRKDGRSKADVGELAEEPAAGATAGAEVSFIRPEELDGEVAEKQYRFGGAGGGAPTPRGAIGGMASLLAIGGGIWFFNNALYNGASTYCG